MTRSIIPRGGWVVATATALFALLAASVRAHAFFVAGLDTEVASEVLGLRDRWLTGAAHALSFVGSEVVVGLGALLLVLIILRTRGPRQAAVVAATMAASVSLTVAVKAVFARSRPGAIDRLGPFDGSYSFPSGHTLNSAVLLGLVCLALVPLVSSQTLRRSIVAGSVVMAAGVGASRIYLGYHWTTDVLASWCIAAVLLVAAGYLLALLDGSGQSGAGQVRRRRISA